MTPPASVAPVVPMAWAVVDGNGAKWNAYGEVGDAERCAENWNAPRVRRDYGPAQPCRVLPLYAADVPALMARIERAEEALRRFADLGDESRYPRRPSRLDVPFEWYVNARAALRAGGG